MRGGVKYGKYVSTQHQDRTCSNYFIWTHIKFPIFSEGLCLRQPWPNKNNGCLWDIVLIQQKCQGSSCCPRMIKIDQYFVSQIAVIVYIRLWYTLRNTPSHNNHLFDVNNFPVWCEILCWHMYLSFCYVLGRVFCKKECCSRESSQ